VTAEIRPFEASDVPAAERVLDRMFGGQVQARLGEVVDVLDLPGFVAVHGGDITGLVTYRRAGTVAELAALVAEPPGTGVGTRLVDAVVDAIAGTSRLWLVTTNDNVRALRFYQRRGFRIVGVEAGGVDRARALKPSIPLVGEHGIELHDELVLERRLRS
jgi:ribosomal protein S18 acetylase RimI-like enzyme